MGLLKIRDFYSIFKLENHIIDKFFLDNVDITLTCILASISPLKIAVLTNKSYKVLDEVNIKCERDSLVYGAINGRIEKVIDLESENLLVINVISSELNYLNPLQRYVELSLIARQSKKEKYPLLANQVLTLAAIYSLPRKVLIVTVKGHNYLNIFPMDLHMKSQTSNNYVFALQPSNLATKHLLKNKKIVISEIDSNTLPLAYSLGSNHGTVNLHNQSKSFNTRKSPKFNFEIPENSQGLLEVFAKESCNIGSHILHYGKIMNRQIVESTIILPYHIHRFHYHEFYK